MLHDILTRLERATPAAGEERWLARCPCYGNHRNGDRNRSFVVWADRKRNVVRCHCYRGCRFEEILRATQTEIGDWSLRQWGETTRTRPMSEEESYVATYEYRDERGDLRYQVLKASDKRYLQRRPVVIENRTLWAWGLVAGWYDTRREERPIMDDLRLRKDDVYKGIRLEDEPRIPYRLPELVAADPRQPVMITEGEKDCERLRSLGFVATTNSGGAGHWTQSHSVFLAGRRVVVWPDLDQPGIRHAAQVAGLAIMGGAAEVRIAGVKAGFRPPVGGKDVSDWLDTVDDEYAAVIAVCKRLRVYTLMERKAA